MLQPHRSLRLGAALIAAALAGWLGSSSMASRQAAATSGSVTDPQETELLSRFGRGELSEHEHRRLLERLLARERFDAAQQVLQPLLERHPERLHLILLRADLLRLSGSPGQARHHLDQLLSRYPNHPDALRLRVLVDLQRGHRSEATLFIRERFQALPPGERTEVGLLLADLKRQHASSEEAAALYRQLAAEAARDARPVLALAMLRGEQGRAKEMQVLLQEARQRRGLEALEDPLIDAVGARWGVQAQRHQPAATQSRL